MNVQSTHQERIDILLEQRKSFEYLISVPIFIDKKFILNQIDTYIDYHKSAILRNEVYSEDIQTNAETLFLANSLELLLPGFASQLDNFKKSTDELLSKYKK